jgi:hypothetical protein
VEEPVKLLRGTEYLTDDGTIELLPAGIEQVKKAHAAGRNVLVELGGRDVLVPRVDGRSTMSKIQCRQDLGNST